MLLTQLKGHIKNHRVVSLFDLINRFNADPEVIRDMLQLWIRKGKIRALQKTTSCGSKCVKCHPYITETYEWCAN